MFTIKMNYRLVLGADKIAFRIDWSAQVTQVKNEHVISYINKS